MGTGKKLQCVECDFTFSRTEGATRNGSAIPFFCFACCRVSNHFLASGHHIEKLEGRLLKPIYMSHIIKALRDLRELGNHQLAENIYHDIRPSVLKEEYYEGAYLSFVKSAVDDYFREKLLYQQKLKDIEKLKAPKPPDCLHCEEKQVFSLKGVRQCPLCGGADFKLLGRILLD